jgi:hypothetical protein
MPHQAITIEFDHSSSPRFKFALEESRKQPSFKESNKVYSVVYKREEFEAMHRLLEYLKTLRNKRVHVDGNEMPWDEVFHYLWCYELRRKAYDPVQYCMGDARQFPAFNPWGCLQAIMPLSNDTQWLHYGKFDSDGSTWVFDKERIWHSLKANTHRYRFCPALDITRIQKILEAFPETVNPKIDKDWEYDGVFDRHLVARISAGPEKEKSPYGVKPSSPKAIKNIYNKILSRIS